MAAPCVITSFSLAGEGRPAPSNRITMACIGLGGEGMGKNLNTFLHQPDAQVLAVCDVDPERLSQGRSMTESQYGKSAPAGTYKGCGTYKDFREVLARDDIDAVMISSPDHWHCLMSVMAVRAGKDVICEKPTLTVQEGRTNSNTVKRYGAVFQTSTEDRSLPMYHRMAELVRNGRIGKLQRILVKLPAGPGGPGDPTPRPVPQGFDYDMWLGPAPWAPYTPGRIHFNFRWITDYSGGMLTDWGAHLLDTAQWANDTERSGPVEVSGTGKCHSGGLYNTHYEYHLEYKYASGVELIVDSGGTSLKFEGTAGWVGNAGWTAAVEASSPEILKSTIGPGEIHLYTCPAGEHRNFLDCVKSRREPYFPAEIGHRCATVMHIGNIAMWLGRKLRWDAVAEHFVDDPGADRFLSRAMRAPWRF
ncbi:MAG: Gfo/Idh/MocA family oxidoreductase [Planctomycetota bacterium]|nr:Gfo/Idh/MocA family oxidoreductase [Planctomycetota bacterium]